MNVHHPWLNEYPIEKVSRYLILGTHPPMPYKGTLFYYYGNMKEFWRFLDKVYPYSNLYNDNHVELHDILAWQKQLKLSITDMVYQTHEVRFSTDKQMGKIDLKDLNPNLERWIKESAIECIYFTSFGGSKSAKNLFKKWLKDKMKINVKLEGHINEINIFNRIIKLIDLFSPSPTAKRSASRIKEYQKWKLNQPEEKKDYDSFRIDWYKKHLPEIH
jgi:G:T/U-mismatch repair DNA glycosylase